MGFVSWRFNLWSESYGFFSYFLFKKLEIYFQFYFDCSNSIGALFTFLIRMNSS